MGPEAGTFSPETRTAQSFPSDLSPGQGSGCAAEAGGTSRGYCGAPREDRTSGEARRGWRQRVLMTFATRGPMDHPHWPLIPFGILTLAGGKEAAVSFCRYFSPPTRVLLTP